MNSLKKLREQHGLTQTDLGKILDVEKSTVSKYENGRLDLSSNTITQLCDYFQVSADYLLGRREENYPEHYESYIEDVVKVFDKNPYTRLLFDRSSKMSKEELEQILKIIEVIHAEKK